MKTKLYITIFFLTLSLTAFGQFQMNSGGANEYYHDLNTDIINDNSNDFVIAGNLFDANFSTQLMVLFRKSQNGTTVWEHNYVSPGGPIVRVLDVVNYFDKIFATGYIELNGPGTRTTFIADINAVNGLVTNAFFYDVLTPPMNSQGLKIIVSNSDADGDGVADLGLVVGGYFSNCVPINTNGSTCTNLGFVLRTDFNLNTIWMIELDNNNTTTGNFDYDFINGITETPTGFFLTGSVVGIPMAGVPDQQGVLAHKIDFMGNFVWDGSYIFGNANDVSVDAYYDATSSQIFMLANYSQTHYFGVTVYNDATGVINNASSWYVTDFNDLNTYAFKLTESITNSANLVISGYDRDQVWQDALGNPITGQSNIFVYEFDKSTGAQVGQYTQYLVPHIEHSPEELNFWSLQMPLIYYPDMSYQYTNNDGTGTFYFHVGYRTIPSGETWVESLSTNATLQNVCINLRKTLTLNPLLYTPIVATSGFVPYSEGPIVLNANPMTPIDRDCDDTILSIINPQGNLWKLYPNPCNELVYVTSETEVAYTLFDEMGRKINSGSVSRDKPIQVSHLSKGIYFVSLINANSSGTIKLVKD